MNLLLHTCLCSYSLIFELFLSVYIITGVSFVASHTHSTVLRGSVPDVVVFITFLFIIIVTIVECSHAEIIYFYYNALQG